ncbi:hypothetical protein WKI68_04835 [Streptomyces sp. MS1.HAVA.3]|uniref:Transposase n=1 Tax=Streptomyces caledonius TaxID=3134107 RepID=A0ABU8TZA7_9ACTN
MPVEYGPWGRVYDLFRRWQRDGTWHRVLTRLQSPDDAKGGITWDHVGSERRLHGVPCSSACGRARKRGDCRRNRRAACSPRLLITGWAAHAAESPPSCTWRSSRAKSRCRSW